MCIILFPWIAISSHMLVCVWCILGCLLFIFVGLGKIFAISVHIYLSCSVAAQIFFTYCLIPSVCIMTWMGYFSSSVNIVVGIVVLVMNAGFLVSIANRFMSCGLLNSCSTYCFSLSLNFLNWYFASLCLAVVPQTAPNSSTSSLKFRIEGVFGVWFKFPPHPPRPW